MKCSWRVRIQSANVKMFLFMEENLFTMFDKTLTVLMFHKFKSMKDHCSGPVTLKLYVYFFS